MRIGMFSDTYPPFINGVSTSIIMLKKALEKKGHEVFVVTINNENLSYKYEDNNKTIRIPGLPIGIYDYRLSGIYPIKAVNRIKKWKLDVIHTHTEFGIGTFARIIAKQFDIPLVHTYHTMYEDHIHYITKGYFKGLSNKIVEYFSLFYCDRTISELIVPTKKTYDLFKDKYKVNRNIYIVPTGIEVERFYKENFDKKSIFDLKKKLGIGRDDFVLMYLGRIGAEKNVDYLMDVHRSLLKKYNNLKLLIVGDGPDLDKLKKLASHSDFKNSVIFTGKVPFDNVPLHYQLADIFVTASQSETQGLTVIEAMAASVPVVCIKDDSFMNTVIDDFNGYMFRTKKQCRTLIADLYENPSKLNILRNQARTSSNQHSDKYFAERVLDVYKIAIDNYRKKDKNLFHRIRKAVTGKHGKNSSS